MALNAASVSEDVAGEGEPLLDLLRRLPCAFPHAPILWIPKSLKQQVGAMFQRLVADAAATADSTQGDARAERAHRLCRVAPQLLLRAPSNTHGHADAADPHCEAKKPTMASIIRERLKLAQQGSWARLVEACLEDLGNAERCHVERARLGPRDADGKLTPAAAQAAAVKARTGSLRSAAAMLTGLPAVPPGRDTDMAVEALFRTTRLTEEEQADFDSAITAAAGISQRARIRVTARLVGQQVAFIKLAAGPGPSGWRNSYLQAIYGVPDGPTALCRWCSVWAQGSIAPWLVELWTPALARPFWKDTSCTKIRNVLCSESLLKFPMGVVVRAAAPQIANAAGTRQFGVGIAAGASREVAEVRAAAALYPDNALISLDVQNAFGEVRWADALWAAVRRAPKLAVPMAAMWRCGFVQVFLPDEHGEGWHAIMAYGSLT